MIPLEAHLVFLLDTSKTTHCSNITDGGGSSGSSSKAALFIWSLTPSTEHRANSGSDW